MKKYLSELHTKPHAHKRRFALVASGVTTLLIFAVWSFVRFGDKPQIAKSTTGPVNLAATIEAGALDKIVEGMKSAWFSITTLGSNGGK